MPNRAVQDFYTNEVMREAVRQYFQAAIEEEAVRLLFDRKDVSHMTDARDLINSIFSKMSVEFSAPHKTNNSSPR